MVGSLNWRKYNVCRPLVFDKFDKNHHLDCMWCQDNLRLSDCILYWLARLFAWKKVISFLKLAYLYFLLFHDGGHYHIEISPLVCSANHWTGFYVIETSVMKELSTTSLSSVHIPIFFEYHFFPIKRHINTNKFTHYRPIIRTHGNIEPTTLFLHA